MSQSEKNRLNYVIAGIGAFAERKNISPSEAFLYLYQNNGISFLCDYYDAEHTLSMDDMLDDLERICGESAPA